MAASKKERDEFIQIMQAEYPHRSRAEVLAMARTMMRYSATSNRIAEEICSIEVSPAEEARRAATDEANDRRIKALAAEWGMVAVLSGDPRGYTVKLKVPSGRTNDWGREGIGVPQ